MRLGSGQQPFETNRLARAQPSTAGHLVMSRQPRFRHFCVGIRTFRSENSERRAGPGIFARTLDVDRDSIGFGGPEWL